MRTTRLLSLVVVSTFLLNACGGSSGSGTGGRVQPLLITSVAPPSGKVQTAYGAGGGGFSLSASGGVAPYSWNWTAAAGSSLPPGLALPSTGAISGTPTSAGSYSVTVTVKDSASPASQTSANYTIDIGAQSFAITSSGPPGGMVGRRYDTRLGPSCSPGSPNCLCIFMPLRPSCHIVEHGFQLTAAGGTSPYSWQWAATAGSTLPPGLTISSLGLIDGSPTTAGSYGVGVTVSDSSTPAAQLSANYTIVVSPPPPPQISTVNSPSAVVNVPYSFTFVASNGQLPLTWTETGALPAGLSFGSGGVLSGKPTVTGSFPISVMVQDSAGQNATPQNFTVQVTVHGFAMSGNMASARISHTATLLNDGTVLIAGGQDDSGVTVANSELYAPAGGTFTVSGALGTPRYFHTATLLGTGKVLVAGGDDMTGNAVASAELYDPVGKTFSALSNMVSARDSFTATLLGNGKVLLAGGGNANGIQATAELFDPSTGSFSSTGSMSAGRAAHTATLLGSGKVLVTGGVDSNGNVLDTAELYDPTNGTFTLTAGKMSDQRSTHSATLLGNGKVLLTGGDSASSAIASAEVFDPSSGTFATTGSMGTPRSAQRATLLNNGTVLVEGGSDQNGSPLVAAELYDPGTGQFAVTGSLQSPRFRHTATLLATGDVLITGGADTTETLATAELYH